MYISAIPEDALNDESDTEDKENPDSRISSELSFSTLCFVWNIYTV